MHNILKKIAQTLNIMNNTLKTVKQYVIICWNILIKIGTTMDVEKIIIITGLKSQINWLFNKAHRNEKGVISYGPTTKKC